jgi:hypothetical protein
MKEKTAMTKLQQPFAVSLHIRACNQYQIELNGNARSDYSIPPVAHSVEYQENNLKIVMAQAVREEAAWQGNHVYKKASAFKTFYYPIQYAPALILSSNPDYNLGQAFEHQTELEQMNRAILEHEAKRIAQHELLEKENI